MIPSLAREFREAAASGVFVRPVIGCLLLPLELIILEGKRLTRGPQSAVEFARSRNKGLHSPLPLRALGALLRSVEGKNSDCYRRVLLELFLCRRAVSQTVKVGLRRKSIGHVWFDNDDDEANYDLVLTFPPVGA